MGTGSGMGSSGRSHGEPQLHKAQTKVNPSDNSCFTSFQFRFKFNQPPAWHVMLLRAGLVVRAAYSPGLGRGSWHFFHQ